MATDRDYLIWSNEHRMWWHGGSLGYTTHLDLAGRYTREKAIDICFGALKGSKAVPNEVPVRAADMHELCDRWEREIPAEAQRDWR